MEKIDLDKDYQCRNKNHQGCRFISKMNGFYCDNCAKKERKRMELIGKEIGRLLPLVLGCDENGAYIRVYNNGTQGTN